MIEWIYKNFGGGDWMPKISTHLHLALKLCEKIEIEDKTSFFLGNSYPDCWNDSVEEGERRHCAVDAEENDFNLGWKFHLWVDDRMKDIDTGDISKYDCMICDMPVIGHLIEELKQHTFTGKEAEAMNHILSLESEPIPLYLVPAEKMNRYEEMLDRLVDLFLVDYIEKSNE